MVTLNNQTVSDLKWQLNRQLYFIKTPILYTEKPVVIEIQSFNT